MTDRYTELVKAAYEAQQARDGERYKDLTNELTKVDTELEALSAQREAVVAHLEGLDDAVEGARDALDAYFAGRDEDADEPTESNDGLFDAVEPLPTEEDEYASAKANGALS